MALVREGGIRTAAVHCEERRSGTRGSNPGSTPPWSSTRRGRWASRGSRRPSSATGRGATAARLLPRHGPAQPGKRPKIGHRKEPGLVWSGLAWAARGQATPATPHSALRGAERERGREPELKSEGDGKQVARRGRKDLTTRPGAAGRPRPTGRERDERQRVPRGYLAGTPLAAGRAVKVGGYPMPSHRL